MRSRRLISNTNYTVHLSSRTHHPENHTHMETHSSSSPSIMKHPQIPTTTHSIIGHSICCWFLLCPWYDSLGSLNYFLSVVTANGKGIYREIDNANDKILFIHLFIYSFKTVENTTNCVAFLSQTTARFPSMA